MSQNSTVYLIDGNAYIHRAYHAITSLSTKDGLPTNAVYGFVNILLRVIREKRPHYLAIAFDSKGPTFRNQIYGEYKSNRPPMPEDLVVQLPHIKRVVEAHNILTTELVGVEADDLLASMTKVISGLGHRVVVVSGDKDLLQLVSDNVNLWDPMQDKVMDEAAVLQKYKVPPAQLLDLFALMGDASDNIPGVPGVGPKTAEKLINEYGTLENLYGNIDSVKRLKLRETLSLFREQAFLSRRLVRLKEDVEVAGTLEEYVLPPADEVRLAEIYRHLEFSRLLKDTAEVGTVPTDTFTLVRTVEELGQMAIRLNDSPYLALDTETTGLDTITAELVGISLGNAQGEVFYLPLSHWDEAGNQVDGQLSSATVFEVIGPFLQNPELPKLGHNLKFDYAVLAAHGIIVAGPLWDTMIASYLVEPTRRSHKLDLLAGELLHLKTTSFAEVTGGSKRPDAFRYVPLVEAGMYSCEDVAVTILLWQYFEPLLDSMELWPVFDTVETPLIPILAEMERHGILIDSSLLGGLSEELDCKLQELDRKIIEIAGPFNINSPQQLAEILFEKLQLPHGRKTKTGYSTDMKVLEKLAGIHELPRLIIEYRNLAKLISTYVDKLPKMVHPQTGRLHTSFNQAVTATGRLSSSDPNLQNIPVRTPEGQRIREAFIPQAGWKFMAADYSQIDLRVLAHYSRDSALVAAFQNAEDVHLNTAMEIFRVNPEVVTGQMRRIAKSINFGIVYGISAFGLAEQLQISRKEAATFIERYFSHFQGVKRFMEESVAAAKKSGFVTTLLGRRRQLPDINSPSKTMREFAERTALNTPIQGTAADIIKLAGIEVDRRLKSSGLQARMLLQIHDELILEVPGGEVEETASQVKKAMETVVELAVPLLVNLTINDNLSKL